MISIILSKKPIVIKDGVEVLDLTEQIIEFTDEPISFSDSFYVSDDMAMRPDLLSYLSYGITDYFDLIMKFNSISNPFSIDKNDLILAPKIEYMAKQIKTPEKEKLNESIKNQYLKKEQQTDQRRTEYFEKIQKYLKNIPVKKISTTNLPPNFAKDNATEIQIVNEKIHLGE